MSGVRILRRLRDLLDVTFGTPSDGDVVTYDTGTDSFVLAAPSGGGGSYQPLDADLTAIAALTTDAFGRSLLSLETAEALLAAAGGAAAADLSAHTGDTSDAHDASAISLADAGAYFAGTDVEAALQELGLSAPQIGPGVAIIRPVSGFYYTLCHGGGTTAYAANGNNVYAVGTQWYLPFALTEDATIDRVAVACHSGGTSVVGRFSLYGDDGYGRPTGVPVDFGTITLAANANALTVSQALLAGRVYHLAFAVNSHVATANIKAPRRTAHPGMISNDVNTSANDGESGWYTTGVTGAPPSNPSLSLVLRSGTGDQALSSYPMMFVRVA